MNCTLRVVMAGLMIASSLSSLSFAAPPDVKSLFPRGATAGSTVDVTITGKTAADWQVWPSRPGLAVEIPDASSTVKVTVSPDAEPGIALLRFYNPEGTSSPVPFVIGRLPEVPETEPNTTLDKAQVIEHSSVVNGKLAESADVDHFRIDVKQGQTLVAVADANWKLGSPVDIVMQVLSEQGIVLGQVDDDRGNDPLIVWTAPEDARVIVRLFGFPATPNSSIRFANGADYVYRLTLTTGPFVTHAEPSAITAGQPAAVKLAGWNLGEQTTATLAVSALSPGQAAVLNCPEPISLVEADGPVIVVAEPCDRSNPVAVTVGATICGVIDQRADEDAFRFTGKKGDRIRISVESRALGYPLDPLLRIFNSEGKQLAESDDASRDVFDSDLKFTVPADGDYTVAVRDLFENGGWRFAWRISLRALEPTVELSVKADAFAATPGTPLEIPVTVTRNDGFAEELEVRLEGLPEGVVAEPVKSEAKGDSSKSVKFSLTADNAMPFSGAIRIVGHFGENRSVTATAALAAFNTSLSDLWLTILPKKDPATPDSK